MPVLRILIACGWVSWALLEFLNGVVMCFSLPVGGVISVANVCKFLEEPGLPTACLGYCSRCSRTMQQLNIWELGTGDVHGGI